MPVLKEDNMARYRTFENPEEHRMFDLHAGLHGDGTWFTAQLFRLIAKADSNNRAKIAMGFPDEVETHRRWSTDPDYMKKEEGDEVEQKP